MRRTGILVRLEERFHLGHLVYLERGAIALVLRKLSIRILRRPAGLAFRLAGRRVLWFG